MLSSQYNLKQPLFHDDEQQEHIAEIPLTHSINRTQGFSAPIFHPDPHINTEESLIPSQPKPSLKHLHLLEPNEIIQLEKKHNKKAKQLDNLIQHFSIAHKLYQIDHCCSMMIIILYIPFQIDMTKEGIECLIQRFYSAAELPSPAGIFVASLFALLDLSTHLHMAYRSNIALHSTLEYACRTPYRERIHTFLQESRTYPLHSAGKASFTIVNESILYTHNLTGAAATFLPWIGALPTAVQWPLALTLFYGGNRYYSSFSNPDYYYHLEHFWIKGFKDLWNNNPEGSPWLLGELRRWKIAVPLQIALQGLMTTVGYRAFFNFYYLAHSAFSTLFAAPPSTAAPLATLVGFAVVVHALCTRYPHTYHFYFNDHIKIQALLRNELVKQVQADAVVNRNHTYLRLYMSEEAIIKYKKTLKEEVLLNLVNTHKKHLEEDITEDKNYFYVLQHNWGVLPHLIYGSLVGTYLGCLLAPALTEHLPADISMLYCLSITLSIGLLDGVIYQAEKKRVVDRLILEQIQPSPKGEITKPAYIQKKLSHILADTLNIASHIARALTTLGSARRVVGDYAIGKFVIDLGIGEQMLNSIRLTKNKVRSTVLGWPCFKHKHTPRVSSVSATFFNHAHSFNVDVDMDEKKVPLLEKR